MRLKPKAARRLLLAGVLVLLAITALVSLVVVRSWQNDRRTRQLRADGMAAFHEGNYPSALLNLSRFLRREPKDREAWLSFAEAREKVEESGGKHLPQAVAAYSRAWALDETDAKTGGKLLQLYNAIGHTVEARDLAARLRPADLSAAGPQHIEVLIEEASARLSLKALDSTLDDITQRLVALDPDGYRASVMRVEYLLAAEHKNDAARFAGDCLAAHPDDSRFEFMNALVQFRLIATPDDEAKKKLIAATCKSAGVDVRTARRIADSTYSEVAFAGQLIATLDTFGLHGQSLLVVKDAATRLNDPDSKRLLARRDWQAGLPTLLLSDFPTADLGAKGDHSEILAFRALALDDLRRREEAKAILTALRTREGDYAAGAWSKALAAVLESTEPKEALDQLDAAIKNHPAEPVFLYFRGNVLWRLGRADEARDVWNSVYASGLAIGWSAPAVRVTETLLDEGRLDEGAAAAVAAIQRAPSSPASNLVSLRAQTMLIEDGRPVADPAEVIKRLDNVNEQLAGMNNPELLTQSKRMLLPARISLLASQGNKSLAVSLAEGAFAEPGLMTADLARRLAAVSIRQSLGLEAKVLATVSAGDADPANLLNRAMLLSISGKQDDAVRLVDESLAAAPADRKEETAVTRARFHDLVKLPDALDIWKGIVRDYPGSLSVLIAAVRSDAATRDLAFVDELTKRITDLGGSDPDRPTSDVRFAKARALLAANPGPGERDEAVKLMRALVLESGSRLDVRTALIDALLLDNPVRNVSPDFDGAIEQLKAAAAIAPDRAPLTLRLVEILRKQGRSADAVSELSKLALDPAADAPSRLVAADRLAGLGEFEFALRGVESLMSTSTATAIDLPLRRASLLASLRRDREASEAFRRLLQQPLTDAATLAAISTALTSLGDPEGSKLALAKLDNPAITPQDRALALASIAAGASDPKTALAEYTRACELNPANPAVWSALARFHFRRGELPQAEAAVRQGLQHAPDNVDLTIMLQQMVIAGQKDDSADLGPLAEALAKNPATAGRAKALAAVAQAQKEKRLDDAATLSGLAEQFLDDSTTQLFVARRFAAQNPPRTSDAVRIMTRAATRFPGDAQVQELATRLLVADGKWDAALASATAWSALERNAAADLAVGECNLALNRARQALEAVRGINLPPEIPAPPEDAIVLGVLNVRVRSNLLLKDSAAAWKLLQPYLVQSPQVRTRIALPAAATLLSDPAEVRTWIDTTASTMDASAEDDQLAIAQAWAVAASRLPTARAELLKRAQAVTAALVAAKPTGRAYDAHSTILQQSGDMPGALAAAQKAIELTAATADPASEEAQLALAQAWSTASSRFPAARTELLQKAQAITTALLATTPSSRAYEAHASVLQQTGDLKGALAAARESVAKDPKSASALATLAWVMLASKSSPSEISDVVKRAAALPISDYRVLFRLANAAESIEDNGTAIGLYERLLVLPNPPAGQDLGAAKNNLAFLLFTEHKPGASITPLLRAKALVEEAIKLSELSSFYETLGAINAQLADRSGALAAYRKALAMNAAELAASVGLADLLAAGNEAERAEAGQLVARVDTQLAQGMALSNQRATQLLQVKQKLIAK